MSLSLKDFEIMAPVGSRESLAAAIQAGAAAAVIYNNAPGSINMNLTGYNFPNPAVMIEQAKASLDRLYTARDHYLFLLQNAKDGEPGEKELALLEKVKAAREGFDEAMDDDLNTADAMGKMFELVRDANVALDENSPKQAIAAVLDALGEMAGVFGILTRKADDGDEKVKALIEARAKARAEKNWAESDRLRDEITALGYVLKDTKQGQQVTKAI